MESRSRIGSRSVYGKDDERYTSKTRGFSRCPSCQPNWSIAVNATIENRGSVALGQTENIGQFSLLVLINAFVGGMVGLERTVLPLIAEREFGIASKSAILSFIISFGLVKAFGNLIAGSGKTLRPTG